MDSENIYTITLNMNIYLVVENSFKADDHCLKDNDILSSGTLQTSQETN